MKIKTKIAAAAMAAIMAVGFSSCSKSYSWVAKSGDTEIAPGVYMANMLGAYTNALKLSSDTETDILKQTIEDKNAADWILDKTKATTAQYFAVEKKFDEYGLILNNDEINSISQQTDYYWQYLSELYENNGISKESLNLVNTNSYKLNMLFDKIYGEGGEKEVSENELQEIFLSDYAKTTYYVLPLANASGEALSEEEQAKIRERIQSIYDKAKSGDDFYDLILEDEKITADGKTVHEHANKNEHDIIVYKEDSTSFPKGFYDKIKSIETGEYGMFEIENYVVVAKRLELSADSDEYKNSKQTLLTNLKGEEFVSTVEQWGNETEVTYNEEALKQFTPSKIKYE